MSSKSLLKFIAAFGILAVILIFLGVNYVPRIFASSSSKNNSVNAISQARSDYSNELYPRSIKPQLSDISSDFLNRHPYDVSQKLSYTAAEFLNHHPFGISQQLKFVGSDWIERHPANYYLNSDWIERHPSQISSQISKKDHRR
jgi:hypothetical protein